MQIKKQPHDSEDEYEEKLLVAADDQNGYNYVVEPIQCDPTDSEQEEYVEFEMDGRTDGIETLDESEIIDASEYEVVRTKRKRLNPLHVIEPRSSRKRQSMDNSLIELQKRLLQAEHDELRKQRAEKHELEISILKLELAHKTMEHQKRMEMMTRKMNDPSK